MTARAGDHDGEILAQLRAEEPLEQDATQQAVLRHECGVLEEQRGDSKAAIREYLAAFNAASDYSEPLEALVRLYGRRHDKKNNLKLLETLAEVAASPTEVARAMWELAAHRLASDDDLAPARRCLERAVEADPNDAACWLELELLAAREGDGATRMRALEARASLTTDPTWQGLLLVELAEMCADDGEFDRGNVLLDMAGGLEGRARFRARIALERMAQRADDTELQAHALDGLAEMLTQAVNSPRAAAELGVPRFMCNPVYAADAWLRAGELKLRSGDPDGAVAALTAAAEQLGDSGLVARLRLAAADAAWSWSPASVVIAREQLEHGVSGVMAAPLWVRVGLAAETEGDSAAALEAYDQALEAASNSIVPATLHLDLLGQGDDFETFAAALEAEAEAQATDESADKARLARKWLDVAFTWAVRGNDVQRAQAALDKASQWGVSREQVTRSARCLASLCGSDAWYEQATEQLLAAVEPGPEQIGLNIELARQRLSRGDEQGAAEAFGVLAQGDDPASPTAWMGASLAAYAVGIGNRGRSVDDGTSEPRDGRRVAALARVAPEVGAARGLAAIAAVLALRAGHADDAVGLLSAEHDKEPGDIVVAVLFAEVLRANQRGREAADVLAACAASCDDPALSAAFNLESGLHLWGAGAKADAIDRIELSLEHAPRAARLMLSWALRSVDPNDLALRRRAVELAEESEHDRATGALERFGLGVATRDGDVDAWAALEQLEDMDLGDDIADAVAMARLVWIDDRRDGDAVAAALGRIERWGEGASAVARAERYRQARFVERDASAVLRTAREWADTERSLAACLEWVAAAIEMNDREAEVAARRWLSEVLQGEAAAVVRTDAATVALVAEPDRQHAMLDEDSDAARLLNLELAPPGGDCRRRARALRGIGDALGPQAATDASRLAAWSDLARGANEAAREAFRSLTEANENDFASWEGLRAAAEAEQDYVTVGLSLARMGGLSNDDKRAAELWERAGLVLLEHTEAHDDAEIALRRALERDPTLVVAFDKLFRRVRSRNEDHTLLGLIDNRLKVTDDEAELTKMYWERARVLRRMGEPEAALAILRDVTMLEPDHVGALALAGEISITRGNFAEAAPLLARLAKLHHAPKQQRLMSGVAAVDLYEKKLDSLDKALDVLGALYASGLSTPPVRERMARIAMRTEKWSEAVEILETLMEERDTSVGRVEAARLAVKVYCEELEEPLRAERAVVRLLKELPDDGEAIKLILEHPMSEQLRASAVPSAKKILRGKLIADPFDRERLELLAEIARYDKSKNLRRSVLGALVAMGHGSDAAERECAELDTRAAQLPQIVLDDYALTTIADPADTGSLAELFTRLAPVIATALGPSLKTEDVGRKQRLDAGDPLRVEVSRWMASIGFDDFELYVGGRDEHGVHAAADESVAVLIIGRGLRAPLDAHARAAVAREVFALRRGTSSLLAHDDHTIASIVVAACNEAGVATPTPPYAVYREVARTLKKAMSRKLRKELAGVCQKVSALDQDPLEWAAAARRSIDRMALIAVGDASILCDDIIGPAGSPGRETMGSNPRAAALLSFALSPEYLELRRGFGMGVL